MTTHATAAPLSLIDDLRIQRWDDHRFYHRSRINQTLHLMSALCFLASYVLIFVHPVAAVLVGWLLAMVLRQAGHFFFEPKSYDDVNDVTHEFKESIKVGYNLARKVVMLSVWALSPVVLAYSPDAFGLLEARDGAYGYVHNLALLWIGVGVGAMIVRVLQLWVQQDLRTGLVWVVKILTDPFHDVMIYWRSPILLLRGERLDPMERWPTLPATA